ncbi:AmmeMemoRadiSam system protein B [Zoogloea sp.]|uniref:AmmeMemoRadiSam system protein B n=1 Tax=Zoogloea sp. TaxID=49181 RepID=UPI00261F44E8|nr:AmmeMemoRadiSam system protein B [Zoogloea sp.]MDD3355088.1 AmmeMemoRadiSam system protein B [Zoogloea sp.]
MAHASQRPPAVAGMFYPADPHSLHAQVAGYLSSAMPAEIIHAPKAIIVPHAGYIYSGAIAASAYAELLQRRDLIRRVLVLCPTHRVAVQGMALPASQAFCTPLGVVPVDREAWLAIREMPGVIVDDRPHAQEHAIEVQLPFLQSTLDRFEILPIAVGLADADQVAAVIETLWGGPETLIVISSDLSHYQPYRQAQWRDKATVSQIRKLDPTLEGEQACGANAINGLLLTAQRHHLTPHLLDLRNSGDTAGDRDRVVGYAAIAFSEDHRDHH